MEGKITKILQIQEQLREDVKRRDDQLWRAESVTRFVPGKNKNERQQQQNWVNGQRHGLDSAMSRLILINHVVEILEGEGKNIGGNNN